MFLLKAGRLGNQVRSGSQLQAFDHSGEYEIHLFQLPVFQLQPFSLLLKAGQGPGGILPLETAADLFQRSPRLAKDGDGIKEDKEKAAQYFKKLADEGNINCKTQYGLMLYTGEGVKQDWNEAEKYLKQSIEANDSKAMYIYGGLLYKKSGLNYFNEESLSYIKKAADENQFNASLKSVMNYI